MTDKAQPVAFCPDCGSQNLFWHCVKTSDDGVTFWGDMFTCNECGGEGDADKQQYDLMESLTRLSEVAHRIAVEHGWWEGDRDLGEVLFKIVMEVGELGAAYEQGNPPDKHLPQFTAAEIEAADIFIRLMDFVAQREMRFGKAVLYKMAFNNSRPYRHGKDW